MRLKRIILAAVFFILPIALRSLWFYRGIYFGNQLAESPAYSELFVEKPELTTPVANVAFSTKSDSIILFDQAHNNKFTFGEIDLLRKNLLWQGAEIQSLEKKSEFGDKLSTADAFIIIAPTDSYSGDDIERIESFIERGGRLLVIADPTRSYSEYDTEREKSVLIVNKILEPFDLSFRNDYAYNLAKYEGNYRNVYATPQSSHTLTKNISSLVFYASHSIYTKRDILIAADEDTVSSLDDQGGALPLAGLDESGNVFILGDITFMTAPYYQVADNHQLVNNISNFLITGSRQTTLADFPNLFNKPVSIRFASGISLDKDLLNTISDLKSILEKSDKSLVILDMEAPEFDQITMGILPPNEELKAITDKFSIQFDEHKIEPSEMPVIPATPQPEAAETTNEDVSNTIYIPDFGRVPSKGFGFMLLENNKNQINLTLLADSQKNATKLLDRLVSGSLAGCLYSSTIAVCEQDSVLVPTVAPTERVEGTGTVSPSPLEEPTFTPIPTITATPSPTETPY